MPYQSHLSPQIARLLMEQGNIAGQQQAQRGAIWGNAVQNIGNRVSTKLSDLLREKQEAPRRALMDESLALDVEGKRRGIAADDRAIADQEQAKVAAEKVTKVNDWLTLLASAPDPASQQQAYQQGRAQLIESGIFEPTDAPEFFPGPSWVKAKMLQVLPAKERFDKLFPKEEPKKTREIKTRNADGTESIQIVEDAPGQAFTSTPEPKPAPNPTEASLALSAAEGNEAAKKALALIRQQRPPAQGPQPDYEWITRDGKPLQIRKGTAQAGDSPYRAPQSISESAQDRQRSARTDAARDFLTRLNELRGKINTKMGPSAGATGYARRAGAAMGMDPDVAEYERIRAAGGRALAVAIMGAQNLSDADANAWANMLPDARTDEQTAARLTTQVERMLEGMTSGDTPAAPANPVAAPSAAPAPGRVYYDADGNPVKR